jgi:hypothetical protein
MGIFVMDFIRRLHNIKQLLHQDKFTLKSNFIL